MTERRDYVEPKVAEHLTLSEAVERIHLLEAALMPFALIGVKIADARMRIGAETEAARVRGEKVDDAPAGGCWVNNIRSSAMLPCETYFYTAIDARGRAVVEARMLASVDAIVELTNAEEEKAKAIDSGERSDH